MSWKFNPFTGTLDRVGAGSSSGGSGVGDGTESNPFILLNVKKVESGMFHKIGANLESVVTRSQQVDGVLIVEGVNTVL